MSPVRWAVMTTVMVLLVGLFLPNYCFAANYEYSYWLLDPDGSNSYRLTVSVTPSLYEYYRSKDNDLYSHNFVKFVTPGALKPIADNLWSVYKDDEDFANGVLMIVHQIPYEESAPQKYPVETIVENRGDCDLLSFVAASIMTAGGLDVVLLYYERQKHMNVGVHLSHEPEDARFTIQYYRYGGKRYYVAECTGGNWEDGWRVGECPEMLKNALASVVTLEGSEQWSPGHVSSSYSALAHSSITLTLSSTYIIEGSTVTFTGQISPIHPNKTVTIYARLSNSPWKALQTVKTDSDGKFSYMWAPRSSGIYYVWASWSGDTDHAGADSDICTFIVIPLSWILVAMIAAVLIGLLTTLIRISKPKKTTLEEPFSEENVNLEV